MSSRACRTSLQNKTPRNPVMFSQAYFLFWVTFPPHTRYTGAAGTAWTWARGAPLGGGWPGGRRGQPRRRPPGHVTPGAQAAAAEAAVMKPRPASFVDNKLKQRVIQVRAGRRRASRWSASAAPRRRRRAAPAPLGCGRGAADSSILRGACGAFSPAAGRSFQNPPGTGAGCSPLVRWTSAQISEDSGDSL